MAYVKKSDLRDVRKANVTFTKTKEGKRISADDASHMLSHLDRDNLTKDDSKIIKALESHISNTDPNHIKTDVNPYNSSEQWITVNGHHILMKAGDHNFKGMFKATDKKSEHHAVVKRRTDREDGTAKKGDKREFDFSFNTADHPLDNEHAEPYMTKNGPRKPDREKRVAEDKKHNLVTVYQGKDEHGNDMFRRLNMKELKNLTDKRGKPKMFV